MKSKSYRICLCFFLVLICMGPSHLVANQIWPGFVDSGHHNEQVREIRFAEDARAIVVAPAASEYDPDKPTLLVIYATPNGNTAEQTLGCQLVDDRDWHFDIQQVAAQWRLFRMLEKERNSVLVCVQANMLSWPAWKAQRPTGPRMIRQIVESLAANLPGENVRLMLTGHSGGGSFLFGYLDSVDEIPLEVERIAFLDANYSFDNELHHGEKLLKWLAADEYSFFLTLAYDDRNIELDGKKVVGPTGGTYRATHRMLDFMEQNTELRSRKINKGSLNDSRSRWSACCPCAPESKEHHLAHPTRGRNEWALRGVNQRDTPLGEWGQLNPTPAYKTEVQADPYTPSKWHCLRTCASQEKDSDLRPATTSSSQLLSAEPGSSRK